MKISSSTLLKANRMIRSNRLKFLMVYAAEMLGLRYTIVRFDPTSACNLRCQMCYFSNPEWRKQNPAKVFEDKEIALLAKYFFPSALQLHIGCAMEPTVYKNFPDIFKLARQYKVPFVGMVSNGQLIKKSHIVQLIEYGLDELTLSTHGVKPETYERMMTNASFSKFINLLTTLDETKREMCSETPRLRLNYTTNPDNMAEIRKFFDIYGKFDIDTIQMRPIADFGDVAYTNKDLKPLVSEYDAILADFKAECAQRGITLLYNDADPTYSEINEFAPVYQEGVLRTINPGRVWQDGFDWRTESIAAFKQRTGFRRKMLEYGIGTRKINYQPSLFVSSQVSQ